MTNAEAFEAIRKAAEIGGVDIDPTNKTMYTQRYGKEASISVQTKLADGTYNNFLGFDNCDYNEPLQPGEAGDIRTHVGYGKDPVFKGLDEDPSKTSAFKDHPNATVTYSGNDSGSIVTITDTNDFKISFLLEDGGKKTLEDTTLNGKFTLDVTDKGPMDLQIGANEGQQLAVKIPPTDAKSLYIDDLNVVEIGGADEAIARIDNAIGRVSEIRSKLGAYSNRLEFARTSLDESSENVTSALSRIKDTDMAKEMTEYTKYNVLAQAGTSALSQANEIPQMALQLLQ